MPPATPGIIFYLGAHSMYIGLSILTVVVLLCLLSKSLRKQFSFLLLPLLIISGISLGYFVITGRPPTQIPGAINAFFSDPQLSEEATP